MKLFGQHGAFARAALFVILNVIAFGMCFGNFIAGICWGSFLVLMFYFEAAIIRLANIIAQTSQNVVNVINHVGNSTKPTAKK